MPQPRMPRRTAWALVAAGLCLLFSTLLASRRLEPLRASAARAGSNETADKSDTRFHREVVARVRGGQPYYEAVRDEFRLPIWSPSGFHPTSVFNWRLPTYAWLLAALPTPGTAKSILVALAAAAALCGFATLVRRRGPTAGTLTVLLVGPLAWCVAGEVFYFADLWAGVLITISLSAYGLGRWKSGTAAGMAAVIFRELAVLYCVVMFFAALARRRGSEAAAWMAGLVLFGVLFAFHVHMVSQQLHTANVFAIGSWLRFSGLPFVLRSVQGTNVFLILLPAWVSAVWLTAAVIGLAGWRDEMGRRVLATVLAYTGMLAVLGAPGTYYWGLMFSPLLVFGIAALPQTLKEVCIALKTEQPSTRASESPTP